MTSDLAALTARLEKAKEGSRELDAKIDHWLEGWVHERSTSPLDPGPDGPPMITLPTVPKFTTDLSAAVALCERALPGWHWSIRKKSTNPDFFEGLVTQAAWSYAADRFKASHDCAPLALCLAILRAKASAHD